MFILRYSFYLKILLGGSILLSLIIVMVLGVVNNLDSDKLGITLFTHPLILIYVYFLSKAYIKAIKEPADRDTNFYFLMLSVIGLLLPFHILYLYFLHRHFNILVGISLFIVILWIVNFIIYLLKMDNEPT